MTEGSVGAWDAVAVDLANPRSGRPGPWDRVADDLYGREESAVFRSPESIRRHWFAEWKRRLGYGMAGDRDNVILITAKQGKGEGKSALAFDIARGMGARVDPGDLQAHVAYRALRLLEIIPTLSRHDWVLYDEAGEGLLNTEFWSAESRTLTKAITISRDVHATVLLCVPAVSMFNATFLRALVDYWIQVRSRGVGFVHPKPGERYTRSKGIGWFPDVEWNPLTWTKPPRPFWGAYSRYRRQSRLEELVRFRESLEAETRGKPKATPTTVCATCGAEFSRADALQRHQEASCPGSSARRPAKR